MLFCHFCLALCLSMTALFLCAVNENEPSPFSSNLVPNPTGGSDALFHNSLVTSGLAAVCWWMMPG